jgi:rare lipoprotein A
MKKKIFLSFFAIIMLFCDHSFIEGSSFRDYGSFQGTASWYSRGDRGVRRTTANMEVFNDRELTCAAWGLPFDSLLEVTNIENGKSVIVRVNDRGPARRLVRRGRVVDLTKSAFRSIADHRDGLINVRVSIKSL